MKTKLLSFTKLFFGAFAVLLLFASSAKAGPPLICHVIEIGDAKSLPWISHNWNLSGDETYDVHNLFPDTIAILDSNNSVLVHMETIRRATLYARKDSIVAKELVVRLHARATESDHAGRSNALAWFDAGYAGEAYKQAQWGNKGNSNYAAGLDGYALVEKAIGLRGSDPQMEFAAALITLGGPENDHREHVAKAVAGAKSDSLLSRNLESHFITSKDKTIAEMFAETTTARK